MFVNLAEHAPGRHHVEQADDDARVLPAKVAHGVRWVRQERLPRHDLNACFLAVRLQVLHCLWGKVYLLINTKNVVVLTYGPRVWSLF